MKVFERLTQLQIFKMCTGDSAHVHKLEKKTAHSKI